MKSESIAKEQNYLFKKKGWGKDMTKEKETATKRVAIAIGVGLIAVVIAVVAGVGINNHQKEKLLAESPLQDYSVWYSLDNYPKFKLEAAERVDELMQTGTDKVEACEIAVEELSDKIYADSVEFIESECRGYDWEESYIKHLEKTQR